MRRKGSASMRPDFVPGEGHRSRAAMSGAEGTTDARRAPSEGNLWLEPDLIKFELSAD
jgi:hypothetical protein